MDTELQVIGRHLLLAKFPEDVFGQLAGLTPEEKERELSGIFRPLSRKLHPDKFSKTPDFAEAEKIFARLTELQVEAKNRIKQNIYGDRSKAAPGSVPAEVVVNGKYVRYASLASGDIADLHLAFLEQAGKRTSVIIKVARDETDNELLLAEKNTLSAIRTAMALKRPGNHWLTCIPEVHESFLLDSGGGRTRANVMEHFEEFLNCSEIVAKLPKGVDSRTIAWMWKRLLGLLDWVHNIGYVHGAVLPPHVMYFPDTSGKKPDSLRNHSVRLVDWCYAAELKRGARLKAWVPEYESFYAPEVLAKKALTPQTDLYMGAKTMLYLLGGDLETNRFPASVPKELSASFLTCLNAEPSRRPRDIQRYFNEFVSLLERLYGKPTYHEFLVPGR